jgi:hypothetical protein
MLHTFIIEKFGKIISLLLKEFFINYCQFIVKKAYHFLLQLSLCKAYPNQTLYSKEKAFLNKKKIVFTN